MSGMESRIATVARAIAEVPMNQPLTQARVAFDACGVPELLAEIDALRHPPVPACAARFLNAWDEHDTRPSNPSLKVAYVRALWEFSETVGLSSIQVTGVLNAWRRTGRSRRGSFDALLAGLDTGRP